MNHPTDLKLGPYGVPRWSDSEGRWVGQLTEDGKVFVEEKLRKYNYNPIALLMKSYPSMAVFAIRHEGYDNTNQNCLIGFVEAALRFDPSLGYDFEAFARSHIRSVVQRYTWIAAYGMTYREYRARTRYGKKVRSYTPEYNFCTESHSSSGFEELEHADSKRYVVRLLNRLSPRQREAVFRHIVQGETLVEIGLSWGVTKQRVSGLFKEAKQKLAPFLAGGLCQK